MKAVLSMVIVLLYACASPQPASPLAGMRITEDDQGCLVMVSEQAFRIPRDKHQLEDAFRELARRKASIVLEPDNGAVAFKCVGPVVFLVQKFGSRVALSRFRHPGVDQAGGEFPQWVERRHSPRGRARQFESRRSGRRPLGWKAGIDTVYERLK